VVLNRLLSGLLSGLLLGSFVKTSSNSAYYLIGGCLCQGSDVCMLLRFNEVLSAVRWGVVGLSAVRWGDVVGVR